MKCGSSSDESIPTILLCREFRNLGPNQDGVDIFPNQDGVYLEDEPAAGGPYMHHLPLPFLVVEVPGLGDAVVVA